MAALTPIKQRFWDNDGTLLAGGKVYVYLAGTTTLTTSYTDSTGSTPNANPVILDAKGEANIYTDGLVKINVLNSADVQVTGYPIDNIATGSNASVISTTVTAFWSNVQAFINYLISSAGSSIVGFIQSGTGAIARTLQAKSREIISVTDFYANGVSGVAVDPTGVTDSTGGINAAITAAGAGGAVYFPPGTYKTTGLHNLNGLNGIQIIGSGVGSTIINIAHASNNLFYTAATVTSNISLSGFSVTSTVTRTGGWVFAVVDAYNSTGSLSNSKISNLQINNQVNGLSITKYQFVTVENILGYSWVGSGGIGIKFGQTTSTNINQGSEAHCKNIQIYGNDLAGGAPILAYGCWIEDTDAVYMTDCGFGGCLTNNQYWIANTGGHSPANHRFTSCIFDSTKTGDVISWNGSGTFSAIQYTNTWVASAGKLTSGSVEACGINFNSTGVFNRISFFGGMIYNCNGSGIKISTSTAGAFTFAGGIQIYSNGGTASTNKYGIWIAPGASVSVDTTIDGCKFSNTTGDLVYTTNAAGIYVNACSFAYGITYPDSGGAANFTGNYDLTSNTISSATRIALSPATNFFNISGTTNIAGINGTFRGHTIQLKFSGILTVVSASQNLQLAGNFVTASGSVLTLMCDGATWYEIGRKA